MKTQWLAAACIASLMTGANAQNYPVKLIRMVVPFPPAGVTGSMHRVVAQAMSEGLGHPVIVDNRPGGGTVVGTEIVAKAAPDGYTTLAAFPSFVLAPALRPTPTFDPFRDFRPVGLMTTLPIVFAVHPSLPVKSMNELVTLARTKPNDISWGAGAGTLSFVIGEMFRLSSHLKLTAVPYQNSGQSLIALAGGHVTTGIGNVPNLAPLTGTGKIRPIAVTTPERSDALPNVPTMRESGFNDMEATNWCGMLVPAATPQGIVTQLNAELVRVLRMPAVAEKLKSLGMRAAPGTPEQFATLIQSESARYTKVIREAGIKGE